MIIKKIKHKAGDRGWVITRVERGSATIWFCTLDLQWKLTPCHMYEETCNKLYDTLKIIYDIQ